MWKEIKTLKIVWCVPVLGLAYLVSLAKWAALSSTHNQWLYRSLICMYISVIHVFIIVFILDILYFN
jgi:hypothetical protein